MFPFENYVTVDNFSVEFMFFIRLVWYDHITHVGNEIKRLFSIRGTKPSLSFNLIDLRIFQFYLTISSVNRTWEKS